MLYAVRTYTLRPGTVAEFEERYTKRLPLQEKHSKLEAFWRTEVELLKQGLHVYPYDELAQWPLWLSSRQGVFKVLEGPPQIRIRFPSRPGTLHQDPPQRAMALPRLVTYPSSCT